MGIITEPPELVFKPSSLWKQRRTYLIVQSRGYELLAGSPSSWALKVAATALFQPDEGEPRERGGSSLAGMGGSFNSLLMACWPRAFTPPACLCLQAAPRASQIGTGLLDIWGTRTLVTGKTLARITGCMSCLVLL